MGYSLGIDVGTTYTAAGICRDGRAEIAPLGARGWSVPSVVYLGADRSVLVGDAALRRAGSEPLRVVREFIRRIGDSVPMMVGGAPVSADSLTGMVLRAVLEQITALEGGPPDHAVVTHPANWGPYKVECLWQAIAMAGLDRLCPTSLMSEPEAAAAHYAGAERLQPGEVIAVYDLGGGTFDAAVLRRGEAGWEFLAPADGIERLGGIDFDQAVISHVDAAVEGRVGDLDPTDAAAMSALVQLRRDCVEAKEALSSDVDVTIAVALPDYRADVRLTRTEFESMVEPSIQLSVEALQRVLRAAELGAESLKAVLLVGGSSRIPLVSRVVSQSLHVPVAVDAHPKHSVALGAALTASQRASQRPRHLAPHEPTNPMDAADAAGGPSDPAAASPSTDPGGAPPAAGSPPTTPSAFPPPAGNGAAVLRAAQTEHIHPAGTSPRRDRRRLWAMVAAATVAVLLVGGGVAVAINRSGDGGVAEIAAVNPSTSPGPTGSAATSGGTPAAGTGGSSQGLVAPTGNGGGAQVLFETQRDGLEHSIWQVTLDGENERPVIEAGGPPKADGHPTFSNSGLLAHLHRDTDDNDNWQLIVSGPDGTGAHKVADHVGQYSRPSWSPDETKIVIPLTGRGGKTDLWIIDLATGERRQLTNTTEQEVDPDWSPDGTKIVFRRDIPPLGDAEIFVIDLTTGTEKRLTNHPGYDADPHFSPDGKTMILTREIDPGNNDIASMSPTKGDAGPVQNLTNHPGQDQDPMWTPNGFTIVWQTDRDAGDPEIYWMKADGSNPQRLTHHAGYDGVPDVRSL